MFYIFDILWLVFIILIVDKKISEYISKWFNMDKHLKGSKGLLIGASLTILTMALITLILISAIGEINLSNNYFSGFIGVTILGLFGGTLARVLLKW